MNKIFNPVFKKAFVVAVITDLLDLLFHFFLTKPMETLTYFIIKFLLTFFVSTAMFNLVKFSKKNNIIIIISGLIFSVLMSLYYRFWEIGEAHVPFGARAPDILGISRDNLILFSGTWWLGHASFFIIGVFVAIKLIKK